MKGVQRIMKRMSGMKQIKNRNQKILDERGIIQKMIGGMIGMKQVEKTIRNQVGSKRIRR